MAAVFDGKRQPDVAGLVQRLMPGVLGVGTRGRVVGDCGLSAVFAEPLPQPGTELGFLRGVVEIHGYASSSSASRIAAIVS